MSSSLTLAGFQVTELYWSQGRNYMKFGLFHGVVKLGKYLVGDSESAAVLQQDIIVKIHALKYCYLYLESFSHPFHLEKLFDIPQMPSRGHLIA